MKKLFKIIPIVLISFSTLVSCNDDNDNDVPYQPEPTTNTIVDIACWKRSSRDLDSDVSSSNLFHLYSN